MKKILLIATQATSTKENQFFKEVIQDSDIISCMFSLDYLNFEINEEYGRVIAFIPVNKIMQKNRAFDNLINDFHGIDINPFKKKYTINEPILLLGETLILNYDITVLVRRMGEEHRILKPAINIISDRPELKKEEIVQGFLNRLNKLYYLEKMGVRIVNSPQSIETSMDKILDYSAIRGLTFKRAKRIETVFISSIEYLISFYKCNNLNIVLKPIFSARGEGIIFLNEKNYVTQIHDIEQLIKMGISFIGQKCIEHAQGDLRVLVFKNKVIAVMDRISENGSKLFNIHQGGKATKWITDPKIEKEIFNDAIKIARCVGCDLCGVDFLHTDSDYYFLETNAVPGLTTIKDFYIGDKKSIFSEIVDKV